MEDIAWWKELYTTQKLSTSYERCILQFLLQTSKLIFIETFIKCDASWTHNYLIQYFLHIHLVWRWLVTKIVVPASQGSNRGCTKQKSPCCASLKKCGRVQPVLTMRSYHGGTGSGRQPMTVSTVRVPYPLISI